MKIYLLGVLVGFGYVCTWRVLFRGLIEAEDGRVDWFAVCFDGFMATLGALFFPLLFIGWGLSRTIGRKDPAAFARRVGGRSREQREQDKELSRREREVAIRRAERELGIGQ